MRNQTGLIFTDENVRRMWYGEKVETRRLILPAPWHVSGNPYSQWVWTPKGRVETETMLRTTDHNIWWDKAKPMGMIQFCPYGQVGDELYVRENFTARHTEYGSYWHHYPATERSRFPANTWEVRYKATDDPFLGQPLNSKRSPRWSVGRFMPYQFARIKLKLTKVEAQLLHWMSDAEAQAEGIRLPERTTTLYNGMYVDRYAQLWRSLHEAPGMRWEDNPWVWVLTYQVLERIGDTFVPLRPHLRPVGAVLT